MIPQIPIDKRKIARFCSRRKIKELALFGSVIRDDFRPDSDVDVLITFSDDAPWSLLDWMDMAEELHRIFGRCVDPFNERALRRRNFRKEILKSRKVIYAG